MKALHILTGSEIEMEPVLKQRLAELESEMEKCNVICNEMNFVMK